MNDGNIAMHTRQRLTRFIVGLLAAGFVLLAVSNAFALDRYASREGVFVGVTAGGGIGKNNISEDGTGDLFTGFGLNRGYAELHVISSCHFNCSLRKCR